MTGPKKPNDFNWSAYWADKFKVWGLGFGEVPRAEKLRLEGGLTEIIFLNIMEKESCERQIYLVPF
jgi:hypothetical protein